MLSSKGCESIAMEAKVGVQTQPSSQTTGLKSALVRVPCTLVAGIKITSENKTRKKRQKQKKNIKPFPHSVRGNRTQCSGTRLGLFSHPNATTQDWKPLRASSLCSRSGDFYAFLGTPASLHNKPFSLSAGDCSHMRSGPDFKQLPMKQKRPGVQTHLHECTHACAM